MDCIQKLEEFNLLSNSQKVSGGNDFPDLKEFQILQRKVQKVELLKTNNVPYFSWEIEGPLCHGPPLATALLSSCWFKCICACVTAAAE